jgi:flagellar assembly factor FliW
MTLLIQSTRFGELSVDGDKVVEILGGILGFSESRFVLLTPEKGPFHWLQSVENPDLAFVVVDPRSSVSEYEVKLNRDEHSRLGLSEASEVVVFAVVTMHMNPLDITMNLLGPLVVNPVNMKALQVVMEGSGYSTRFPYFHHMAADSGSAGKGAGQTAADAERVRAV